MNTRPVRRWLAWSPVAAVLWLAIGACVVSAGGRGCDWSPSTPSGPVLPDWIPPNPPQPPAPTPNPMGRALTAAKWEWRPFPQGANLYGYEAFCADLDGVSVMKQVRLREGFR